MKIFQWPDGEARKRRCHYAACPKQVSITDIISQAMQDRNISPAEFHRVLQEVEKYRKLKADIRN